MRITELFTAQSIALDEAQQDRSQIIDRLVELQATHGNIKDKEAYKKASTPVRTKARPMWTMASPSPTQNVTASPGPALRPSA